MPTNSPLTALSDLSRGTRVVVRDLGVDPLLASRLSAMGLAVGCEAEILANRRRGALLVRARDTRLAIARDTAQRVLTSGVLANSGLSSEHSLTAGPASGAAEGGEPGK